jgi:DNA-binding MarR family transcriptional regulator
VSVAADPSDRRAVVVRRTAAGDRVCAAIRRALAQVEEAHAAAVGPDRYATFRAVPDELAGVPPDGGTA